MNRVTWSLIISLSLVGCTKKDKTEEVKAIPVKVAEAITKDVPYYIATVGHMEAYTTVDIMAQVDGYLMQTYFEDGDYVKKGDLLYLIDQRPYLADLQKAEASLEQSMANLKYAQRTAERNATLVKDDYISKDAFDNLVTNVLVDDALVNENRAAVETAKINLNYTTIYAPMDARAGESLVNDGNLILKSSESNLVTLNQIVPIYAAFFIGEKDLPKVQRYQKKYSKLITVITVEDPKTPPYDGDLTFIDNEVDLSTGMVKLKATVPNEERALWPNQYVGIKLILDTIEGAVLIPAEAIQESPKGKYVFVVKGDQKVEKRSVNVGQRQDELVVVETGVKEGEKVVTEGQINLRPGATVSLAKNEGA
jgi:multidrug efflux system membrane fusion protein